MSYGGGYGRGYGQQYDYRNSDRQAQGAPGAQAYHGVPPPGPYTGPGGNQYYPQAAPGFPPQTSQVYDPPPRPMASGRQAPQTEYSHYDRHQAYQSPAAAPPMGRDYDRRDDRGWNKAPESSRDTGSFQGSSQTPSSKQKIDIDAILKDERLKNVLFSGISKATQKLEESLRAKNSPDNVKFLNEQRKEQSSQLFPSASNESQPKPKSILKRSGDGRSEDRGDIHSEKLSVLEKTLQLLRGKTNVGLVPETKKDVDVARSSAALGQLSSYSDDHEDEEAHLYGNRDPPKQATPQGTSQSNLPFWSAPSEAEAAKRDSASTFDIKEKLYEEWRNTINKKGPEPEKPKPEVSQLQAFISSQMSAGASRKNQGSAPKDNEELDSTVQNILQSIGFNFDLSKRMQELAKQKKKEHDDLQTGIVDQRASFLENAQGIEDMKEKLFSGGSSSIDSFIKQARAETQSGRSSYEKYSERSRSPDGRERQQLRERSTSRDRSSRYYSRSPERHAPSTWSPEESTDYRRHEQERRRSRSDEHRAATPPRGGYGKSDSRGHHHVSERFRDEPKDEYYYPDEHEAVEAPPSLPLLKSYSSQKKSEDLSSGLFPSAKRMPPKPEVENFTVMSKAVDDGDGSFTGTRRIILPSKSDRRIVSKSKSPSFRGSQSPIHRSFKRSASPLSPRPSKERRYDSQEYGYSSRPEWDNRKYDMTITTYRDRSPDPHETARYHSPPVPYDDRDESGNRMEMTRGRPAFEGDYPPETRYQSSPERDNRKSYEYERQWVDDRGLQDDTYQSPKQIRSRSPGYKYKRSPQRFKSPGREKDRSPERERARSPPRRRSPDDRSPQRERARSPPRRRSRERDRSVGSGRRRSPSPGRRRSPTGGRRRSPHRKQHDDYKYDSRPKYGGKSTRDNKKYSPQVPFDKSRYSLDNRKKNAQQDNKSKPSQQKPKVDLSKMSDSERKAHLNKLLEEKGKAMGQTKGQVSTSTAETSKADVSKNEADLKKAQLDKVTGVKNEKPTKPQTSSSTGEKKLDFTKMTPEERKANFAKMLAEKTEVKTEPAANDQLNGNLLSAIERLSSFSLEARKEILLKMTRMTGREREVAINNLSMRQVKVTTLKAHLEKLKKDQNELMRKSRRSGLGSQDPQLIKNSEDQDHTQSEIDRLSAFDPTDPFAEIDMSPPPSHKSKDRTPPQKNKGKMEEKPKSDVSKSLTEKSKAKEVKPPADSTGQDNEKWQTIKGTDTKEPPELGGQTKKDSKSGSSTKKDKQDEKEKGQSSSSSSSFGSSQSKVYYEYVDGGNHWCKFCRTKCNSTDQLFEHLHGKKHISNIQYEKKPWKDSKNEKNLKQQKVGRACTRRIKGSEMLFPVVGFYCSLCKQTLYDVAEASDHMKSDNHYNKYLDYIKANPGHEKKLLLERASNVKLSKEDWPPSEPQRPPPPEPQPPPPTAAPPPPPPPPPPPKIKKIKQDKDKRRLRKTGQDASSGSEDDSFDFGADNTIVEDMDLDEEEEKETAREAKTKVPKLAGKDPSWGPVAAATLIQASDNMKENKEDQDKPLDQFLSIAEGSGSSKLPVVPPEIDLNKIPIPTGPLTLSEMPPEPPEPPKPETQNALQLLRSVDDEEKKMLKMVGIDIDAQEEQPLKAIPVPPPSYRKGNAEAESGQKKPKSLDTLFSKVNSKLASKIAARAALGKASSESTLSEMELRIQQEIKEKLLKEKMKMARKKQKEERAKKPEEPRRKKKVLSDSSSEDSSEESEEEAEHSYAGLNERGQQQVSSDLADIPMPPGVPASEFEDGMIVLSEVSGDKDENAGEEASSEEEEDDGEEVDERFAFTLAGSVALRALIAASGEGSKVAMPAAASTSDSKKTVLQPEAGNAAAVESTVVPPETGNTATVESTAVPQPEAGNTAAVESTAVPQPETGNTAAVESTAVIKPETGNTATVEPTAVPPPDDEDTSSETTAVEASGVELRPSKTTAVEPSGVKETATADPTMVPPSAEDISTPTESSEDPEIKTSSTVETSIVSPPEEGDGENAETTAVRPPELWDTGVDSMPVVPLVEEASAVDEPTSGADNSSSIPSSGEGSKSTDVAPVLSSEAETAATPETNQELPSDSIQVASIETSTVTSGGGESTGIEPSAIPCQQVDEMATFKSYDLGAAPAVSPSPSPLLEMDVAGIPQTGEVEVQQNLPQGGKRGRGRGKRASSAGRGRSRKITRQESPAADNPDNQQVDDAGQSELPDLPASPDTSELVSVVSDESSGKKRSGRRGRGTKRGVGRGRVTRSRGMKSEDATEQDLDSSSQTETSLVEAEAQEPHQTENSQCELEETQESSKDCAQGSHELSQVETCSVQMEEVQDANQNFAQATEEPNQAETSSVQMEEIQELSQEYTQDSQGLGEVKTMEEVQEPTEDAQERSLAVTSLAQEEVGEVIQDLTQEAHEPDWVETRLFEVQENNNLEDRFHQTETEVPLNSQFDAENISSEALVSDSIRNIPQEAGQDNVVTSASDIEFSEAALDDRSHSVQQSVTTECQNEHYEASELMDLIEDQASGLQYQLFEQPQSPEDAGTDSDATITDDVEVQSALTPMDEPDAVVPASLHDTASEPDPWGIVTSGIMTSSDPLDCGFESSASNTELIDHDATAIQPDTELTSHEVTAFQPDTELIGHGVTALQPDTELIGHEVTNFQPDTELIGHEVTALQPNIELIGHEVTAFQPDTELIGHEVTALQPDTVSGSPGMDPPMSGVVSEMDESINAVTFTEEDGLLEGADDGSPSAGLGLDLEDANESMDFETDIKDADDSA